MKKKRICALLLTVAMTAGTLAGCGGGDDSGSASTDTGSTATDEGSGDAGASCKSSVRMTKM